MGREQTHYKPEYCEPLIAHMEKGGSFEAFGATIDAGRSTMYDWLLRYPAWANAKAIGDVKSLAHYEGILYAAATGQLPNASVTALIFKFKSKFRQFGYRDYPAHDNGEDDSAADDASGVPIAQLLKLAKK